MADKRERLLGAGGAGRGLEIGALNAPLLPKDRYDVRYVDYAETEVVRANQFDPSVNPADIVEVDIVWGARPLVEAAGAPVDFIVASHVIEHVPDLIGWLAELHAALKPGGTLGLAVPDKRFTFDALRRDSTLAEAVEAYLSAYRQPSLRQVFDVASLGVGIDAAEVWAGRFDPAARRGEVLARLRPALALVERLKAEPRYNDAHCWVFTPPSFLDLVEELAALELFPFRIEAFHPTEPGTIEFHVRLIALTPGERPDASIAAAKANLAAAASPEAERPSPPAAEPAAAAARGPDPQVERLARDNAALRAALEEIHGSTSWRITAPLRALVGLFRR